MGSWVQSSERTSNSCKDGACILYDGNLGCHVCQYIRIPRDGYALLYDFVNHWLEFHNCLCSLASMHDNQHVACFAKSTQIISFKTKTIAGGEGVGHQSRLCLLAAAAGCTK